MAATDSDRVTFDTATDSIRVLQWHGEFGRYSDRAVVSVFAAWRAAQQAFFGCSNFAWQHARDFCDDTWREQQQLPHIHDGQTIVMARNVPMTRLVMMPDRIGEKPGDLGGAQLDAGIVARFPIREKS